MTPTPIFYGTIERGKLVLEQPERYLVWLSALEGKSIELVLRRKRSQRSLRQNRYYWGVVVEILSGHFGYEAKELHEALKFKFLKIHTEEELVTVRSTTTLNTKEFIDYIDRIQRWAASEHDIFIPDPQTVESEEGF